VEGWIEGSGIHLENLTRVCANDLAERISMAWPPVEDLEDEHVQGTLEDFGAALILFLG
jgi:hypothetical protein